MGACSGLFSVISLGVLGFMGASDVGFGVVMGAEFVVSVRVLRSGFRIHGCRSGV